LLKATLKGLPYKIFNAFVLLSFAKIMKPVLGTVLMGRGGFSLPGSGRLKSPLPLRGGWGIPLFMRSSIALLDYEQVKCRSTMDESKLRILTIFGTRPEVTKLLPALRSFEGIAGEK